jgi:hypothetical protein
MVVAHSQPFPLVTLSNAVPTNQPAPLGTGFGTNQVAPIIHLQDVPLSTAIDAFARGAGINYIVDQRLANWWAFPNIDGQTTHEPVISLHWTNLTPKDALLVLLNEHNLVLAEDPATSIARITYTNQVVSPVDINSIGGNTNIIPTIQFQEVPIMTGLDNLARAAGVNYTLDPQISYGQPDKNGQIKAEPVLSLRWENVTAMQAFVALCENYDLVIVQDSATGIVHIKPKN